MTPTAVQRVFGARELIIALVRRDLIVRYEHAFLGIAWALAVPLMQMAIFAAVFTKVVRVDTDVPYPLYVYAGLAVWTFFSSALRSATRSLSDQTPLITKVYFPREAIPLATVIVALVDFLVTLVPLGGLMAWYGVRPTWGLLAVPFVIAILALFAAALALALSVANLFFRDVQHVVEVLLLVWMFATSVVYPVNQVGGTIGRVLALNPLTPIVDTYRALLFGSALPSSSAMIWTSIATLVVFAFAWMFFHRVEHLAAELA
jgi:lipopolysaccharide transport system permease protein